MAELLICMADLGDPADLVNHPVAWKTGDIMWHADDSQEWGDHEDFAKFIAAGYAPETWHGSLGIVKLPLMKRADAAALVTPLVGATRKDILANGRYHFDLSLLERRIPAPDRPTVYRDFKILRLDTDGTGLVVDRASVANRANINVLRKLG